VKTAKVRTAKVKTGPKKKSSGTGEEEEEEEEVGELVQPKKAPKTKAKAKG
jgi:hypothetical protein